MNFVILIGNLAKDPELFYTPNTQTAACKFTIAVSRPRKNSEDQGADFIRITTWGQQAENCNRYLFKGSKVAVRGRITTGSYKDRNGQTVYTTEVMADNVEFLTRAENSASNGSNANKCTSYQTEPNYVPQTENLPDSFSAAEADIPF